MGTNKRVEIDSDDLEILLDFARIGDKAASGRPWHTGFRKRAICSGGVREPLCPSCRAFDHAEALLDVPRT